MKIFKLLLDRVLVVFFLVLAGCVFIGCQPSEATWESSGPVFFPPMPEKPRLQFLKSFSSIQDFDVAGPSAFETFIVGEAEATDSIVKPYGLAISEGKIYVCDVGRRIVEVFDIKNKTFGYLSKDRRLMNPVNIYIDNGKKYVTDPTAGAIFVFDKNNVLSAIIGKELDVRPVDIVVRGQKCFIIDGIKNQVVVLDKTTGKEITRVGAEGRGDAQFKLVAGLAVDGDENIYVTDKIKAVITKFNSAGIFQQTIGFMDTSVHGFVRPKGIDIDRKGRIWVVDAATDVAKVYNSQGQLLLFFGLPGSKPGTLNLPAAIALDYDNVELFQQYAVEGAEIEFLVLISNQYGPNKISVYGFGRFPERLRQSGIEQQPRQEEQTDSVSPLN